MEVLLGAHMSIAGGTPKAIERALSAGCNVLQIFVKNNNRWKGKPLEEDEVGLFHSLRQASELREVVAHASYLINLAAPTEWLWRLSVDALVDELDRCNRLDLSHLVIHPGSHVGEGEEKGIERIARAIDAVQDRVDRSKTRIALEHTAGQGTNIGCRFEHLRDILGACRHPQEVAVCLDTCHLFAAGYDIRQEEKYSQTMAEFDRLVGLSKLKAFHFNDSRKDLGSRVDRHEHIGAGKIGTEAFRLILNDFRLSSVPKLLETPKDDKEGRKKGDGLENDRRNLNVLRSLVCA